MEKTRWHVPAFLIAVLLIVAMLAGCSPANLDNTLTPYLNEYDLPAIAAAVVKKGTIISSGAVGTRKLGSAITITKHDRFHLGSDTKAMTALLAVMLIEEGRLNWRSTPGDVFPEIADTMDSRVRNVSLEQLLSHTSGMPGDNEDFTRLIKASFAQEGNLDEVRYWFVGEWCKLPLESEPGTKFSYSNAGYTVVGAMIERVSGETWDELIRKRVFIPLGLETAGLGCQSSLGRIDAPLGHSLRNGRIQSYMAGPNGDNPYVIGPAGIAHMSVLDFARWAGWNAGNGTRKPYLVGTESLEKLHRPVIAMPDRKDAAPGTPVRGKYALGWGMLNVKWAPYPLLYHGGSNGMNLAHIWLDKKRDIAIVIVTNIGGKKADEALLKLASELYRGVE